MRVHPTDSGFKMSSRSFPPKTKLSIIDILDTSAVLTKGSAKSPSVPIPIKTTSLTPEHDPAVEDINENTQKHSLAAPYDSMSDHPQGHTKSKPIPTSEDTDKIVPDDRIEKVDDCHLKAPRLPTELPLPPPLDLGKRTGGQEEQSRTISGLRPQVFHPRSASEMGSNDEKLRTLQGSTLLPPRKRFNHDPKPPKKHHNDPVPTTSANEGTRRSIFGQYWKKDGKISATTPLGSLVGANSSEYGKSSDLDVDLTLFSPPEHRKETLSPHFSSIEEYNETLSSSDSLPPVPTPLRRYCSDGPLCGGVYPLMSPRSILRTSSYGQNKNGDTSPDSSTNRARAPSDDSRTRPGSVGMELTKSPLLKPVKFTNRTRTPSLLCDDSDSSSSGRRGVQFDPRVTITEYDDEDRVWFTDEELSMFKYEATRLAQRYMLSNPEVAQYFRRGRKDPVTGRIRPRALYTNPVFSTNGDSTFDEDDSKEMRELVEKNIKSVLIVDPNTAILNLFCKSIQQLFPLARIAAVQNGEDALKIVSLGLKERKNDQSSNAALCFDLIIVEERLFRPQRRRGSCMQLQEVARMQTSNSSSLPSNPSRGENKNTPKGISGSEVMKRIVHMAKQSSKGSIFSTSQSPAWIPLLVGVSANLDEDRDKLLEAGSDILWGKPPPKMDIPLRNHLLRALVNKRSEDSS